jgi:hypothetical protein
MISVLPQTEHLHRNANGLTAATQLQLAAGCFIGRALASVSLSGLWLSQQVRQLGDVRRDPPRLVLAEQLGCGASARYTRAFVHCGSRTTPG